MSSAAEDKYFVCRLLSPRPTFPMDMTAAERVFMDAHVVYWREQLAAGRVVVFGPVMDPKGPWGLAVVRAKDMAEVLALEAADPVITAEAGFSYETLPMARAVLPG